MANSGVLKLGVRNELKIVIPQSSTDATLQLLSGCAEILGSEVIQNKIYNLPGCSAISLFTWIGCTVKLNGIMHLKLARESQIMVLVSMHSCLEERRVKAHFAKNIGPVSLVVGPRNVGKTSFCYFMLNYAAKMGRRPIFVDLDVNQSSVAMSGSIGILPIERPSDIRNGFDKTDLSVYYFGHKSPGHNIKLYLLLIQKLGEMLNKNMKDASLDIRSSGVIIDTNDWWIIDDEYKAISIAAHAFQIDNVFVIEEERVYLKLKKQMPRTVHVVYVPKQYGAVKHERSLLVQIRRKHLKEYFYGPEGNANPWVIEVTFCNIQIYRYKSSNVDAEDVYVQQVSFGPHLEHFLLGVSYAENVDENLITTNLVGFVCILHVNMNKKTILLLSPQPGPLPSKICILGKMKLKL